jgi:choline dehydrogenase-like flavoprotein
MNERVDVLIIGAGASGAAVAWSLAETKMRILCLEQGDWQKSSDFPSTGRDWEARLSEDFAISPNRRGLAADYPVNDDDSPIKIANFNGVGSMASAAAPSSMRGTIPGSTPRISGCAVSMAWQTIGRSTTRPSNRSTLSTTG